LLNGCSPWRCAAAAGEEADDPDDERDQRDPEQQLDERDADSAEDQDQQEQQQDQSHGVSLSGSCPVPGAPCGYTRAATGDAPPAFGTCKA